MERVEPAARRLAAALLVAGALAGCPAERPGETVTPPEPVAKGPSWPQREGDVTTWYQERWPGRDVRLVGVDAERRQAVLWLTSEQPTPRLAVEVIDLHGAGRVERWEATADNAAQMVNRYPVFRPLTGTFDADVRRFAGLVARTGPWTRAREGAPIVLASPDGQQVLYGAPPQGSADGDWLMVAPMGGGAATRLDDGMLASYSPVYSPDGRFIAFSGCSPRHAARGTNCSYYLFVRVEGGKNEYVPIARPAALAWGADGALYALGPNAKRTCLWRVRPGQWARPEEVRCVEGLEDADLALEPSGEIAVFGGAVGAAGDQSWRVTWVALATGEVLGAQDIPRATGLGAPGAEGLLVAPIQNGGVAVVERSAGELRRLPGDSGSFVGLSTTRWLSAREVVLVRRGQGSYAVITLAL